MENRSPERITEATKEGRFEEVEISLGKPWYSSISRLTGRKEAKIWRPQEKFGKDRNPTH
jgi:hypothetical protein